MKKLSVICSSLLIASMAYAEAPQFVVLDLPMTKRYEAPAFAEVPKEANFLIPEGAFYFGDNGDVWIMPGSVILPPYSTVTWKYDGDDAVSYKWEYTDMSKYNTTPNDFEIIESTEKDLTYETGSFNIGQTPKITATFEDGSEASYMSTGNYDDTPSYIQVAGHAGDFVYNNMPGIYMTNSYGFSPYSFKYGTVVLNTDFSQKSYVFGNGEEITNEGCTGLACIMPAPGAPYIIDGGVRGLLYFNLEDEAEITVTLRKATKVTNEEYTLGAEIGHATLTGAQFKGQGRIIEGETYLGEILFEKLYQTDAEGNEVEVKPIVDSAIAIVFTGWDSSFVTKFAAFSNEQIYKNGKYDEKANARIGTYAMWTGGTYGNTAKAKYKNIAPAITLHAYFPFVHCEESEILADKAGMITTLEVDQYNYYADLKIACDGIESTASSYSGETVINDWIKVNYTKDMASRQYSNKIDIIVSENTGAARKAVISFIDIDGTKCDVEVRQDGNSYEAATFAEALEFGEDGVTDAITFTGEAQVVYQNNRHLYIKDSETWTLLYCKDVEMPKYKNGDIISNFQITYATNDGYPQFLPVEGTFSDGADGIEISPVAVSTADINAANYHKYVVLNNVQFANSDIKNTGYATDAAGTATIYATWNNSYSDPQVGFPENDGEYIIKGFVSSYNGNFQLLVTEFTEVNAINDVEFDENAPAEYFNLQGVKVNNPTKGIYIVKRGNKVSKEIIK